MIKSAATILAEIDGVKPAKTKRPDKFVRDRTIRPVAERPRTDGQHPRGPIPRDDDYWDNARAYRLAAIEHCVHPLMPRDMYRKAAS